MTKMASSMKWLALSCAAVVVRLIQTIFGHKARLI